MDTSVSVGMSPIHAEGGGGSSSVRPGAHPGERVCILILTGGGEDEVTVLVGGLECTCFEPSTQKFVKQWKVTCPRGS